MYLICIIEFNIFFFYDRAVSIDGLDANINDQNNQLATKQQVKVKIKNIYNK